MNGFLHSNESSTKFDKCIPFSNLVLPGLFFSPSLDDWHHDAEGAALGREVVHPGVQGRGLTTGGRHHLVEEQQVYGEDGAKSELTSLSYFTVDRTRYTVLL